MGNTSLIRGIELIPEEVDDFCMAVKNKGGKVIKKIQHEDGWVGVYFMIEKD